MLSRHIVRAILLQCNLKVCFNKKFIGKLKFQIVNPSKQILRKPVTPKLKIKFLKKKERICKKKSLSEWVIPKILALSFLSVRGFEFAHDCTCLNFSQPQHKQTHSLTSLGVIL